MKTMKEIVAELLEADHEGEDALRVLEDARDSAESLAELGLESARLFLKDIHLLFGEVLVDRKATNNNYGA